MAAEGVYGASRPVSSLIAGLPPKARQVECNTTATMSDFIFGAIAQAIVEVFGFFASRRVVLWTFAVLFVAAIILCAAVAFAPI
jgi:hypothetical protein